MRSSSSHTWAGSSLLSEVLVAGGTKGSASLSVGDAASLLVADVDFGVEGNSVSGNANSSNGTQTSETKTVGMIGRKYGNLSQKFLVSVRGHIDHRSCQCLCSRMNSIIINRSCKS